MDRIYIRDLSLWCIIGTRPEERREKQEVVLNITLETDLSTAGDSDSIDDTVNYRTLKKRVMDMVRESRFLLIERLASQTAALCLAEEGVRAVTVTVDKPGALRHARSVAVEIHRSGD